MSVQPAVYPQTYADGSPVRAGDQVLIDGGTAVGRVAEVIDTLEGAAKRGLDGLGVVVDAQPKGYVFLSAASLREDPLVHTRRGPGEEARQWGAMALGLAAVLLLPALYSWFSAIHGAISTGEVMVLNLAGIDSEMVPWRNGWTRFVAPLLLLAAVLVYDDSRAITGRWWAAAALAVVALGMLGFAAWFQSMGGAVGFILFNGFIVLCFHVDRRHGRLAAFALMVVAVFALVLLFTPR